MAVRARRGDPSRFHGYRATPAQRPRPSDRFNAFTARGCVAFNPSRQASRSERPVGVLEVQLGDEIGASKGAGRAKGS